MAEPFLGEVRIMSFQFAPKGWALSNGQLLPINQNQALFSLLGTTYGGDGRTNFALPDLRARTPIHRGSHTLGEQGGETAHTVIVSELPAHVHAVNASSAPGDAPNPAGNLLGSPLNQTYSAPSAMVPMAAGTIANVGGSQPHNNMQPYLGLSFCIALQGIFPSRN